MAGERPHNFKTKQLNTREIIFERQHFRKLAAACSKAMLGMANWHPIHNTPPELRAHLEELYSFMNTHLRDEFGGYEFDPRLMSGAKITFCDLVEGEIHVQLNYTWQGQTVRFELRCCNDGAPFSVSWPKELKRIGDEPGNFAAVMSTI